MGASAGKLTSMGDAMNRRLVPETNGRKRHRLLKMTPLGGEVPGAVLFFCTGRGGLVD